MPCFPKKDFLCSVEAELLCNACGDVMGDPRQLPCGHDCGVDCIVNQRCTVPSCDAIAIDAQPIRVAAKLIAKLSIRCGRQCGWEGCCGDARAHQCPLEVVSCHFKCGVSFARGDAAVHLLSCPFRMEVCAFCFQKNRAHDTPFHEAKCLLAPVQCTKCAMTVRRKELAIHLESTCPDAEVACPFSEFGCTAQILRKSLESHVSSSLADHCELLVSHVQREKESSREQLLQHERKISELESVLRGTFSVAGVSISEAVHVLETKLTVQESRTTALLEGRLLTVDPSGHCGNFRTIADALAKYRPGDLVILRPGVFTEIVEITEVHTGVVIRGSGSEATFLSGRLSFRVEATLQDLSVINRTDRDAPAVRVVSGNPKLSRVHITSINLSCVIVDGGAPVFDECMISGSKQHCILWKSTEKGTLSKCTLSDCVGSVISVEDGELSVETCDIFGSDANGLTILSGARCVVVDSAVHDNRCSNVDCRASGFVEVLRSSIFRSTKCGLFVCGECTLEATKIFENQLPNVFIVGGAVVSMMDCKVLCGLQHGIVVNRDGFLRLFTSVVSGNCLENIIAEEGSNVEL
jgi:hypothetical protein